MNLVLETISLAFGLMPFNRKKLNSSFAMDYGLIFVIPLFYIVCYYYVNFRGYGISLLDDCNSICRVVSTLFMHVGCCVYLTVYLLTLLRRKGFYIAFSQRIEEIDDLITHCVQLADTQNNLKFPKKKRMFYIIWAFILAIFGLAVFYDVYEISKFYGIYCFIPNMVITFPYVAASIVQGMFISYVSSISERFQIVNILFEKIKDESKTSSSALTIMDIETYSRKETLAKPAVISDLLKTKFESHKKETSKSTDDNNEKQFAEEEDSGNDEYDESRPTNDAKTSEENLPNLFKLHDKILSLSVLVNSEFGPQCVPYMVACFIVTILGIFLATKVMFIVGGKIELMDYAIYLYVIWSFTTMIIGYLVLRLCCNANAYSKQSAMIVHEIMQKKPAFMLINDIYYNKMKGFTLQFLHWESYFQFNGIGLFALDYTFIFSTVSAATSYLIVLLQFDMTPILKGEGLAPITVPVGAN